MSLCLTYRVTLALSLRKTTHALREIHNIRISHQQVANYCKTAAICVKPFTDSYDYHTGSTFTADETYIKIRGSKATSGSSWTHSHAPSSVTRYQTTAVSAPVSSPCGWPSGT